MSSIYVLEPPTSGKVVLNTTYGPLDIELWPKEAPKTVRNFVQLCVDNYYDNTIFHRVIKSFLVQGGDPTGSGTGGESIYGRPFADEFHSRLRFKHRGLVASANAGSPNSNGSQFFMTLDRCDWIDKKNTIFGKVTGDSIFNLLRLGEVETDKNDRPLDPPPKILSVEVIWNPFDDIVPRKIARKSLADDVEEKDQKKKGVKKLNLLSFGEEAEEEEKELATVKEKIKSSHDVLNDPRLLKESSEKEQNVLEGKDKKDMQRFFKEALTKKDSSEKEADTNLSDIDDLTDDEDDEDETKFDERMRLKILKKRRELGDIPTVEKSSTEKTSLKKQRSSPRRGKSEDRESVPKKEKLSLKKKGIGSEARAEHMVKADADLQLLGQAEQERYMNKQRKRRVHGREEETLARLEKFKNSFSSNTVQSSKPGGGDDEEEDEPGWFTHKLKFVADSSNKDSMSRKDDPNEYQVHDPLLAKGKEKFNKMQAKLKRREREWAGKSLT